MKKMIITAILAGCLFSLLAKPGKRNAASLERVFGVWKYEQVFPEDPYGTVLLKRNSYSG